MSLPEALVDDDRTILELFQRLSDHNLRLNPEKVKFTWILPHSRVMSTSGPEGLKLSGEIISVILDLPHPEDKAATRRFIGRINYLSKFCPHLRE